MDKNVIPRLSYEIVGYYLFLKQIYTNNDNNLVLSEIDTEDDLVLSEINTEDDLVLSNTEDDLVLSNLSVSDLFSIIDNKSIIS